MELFPKGHAVGMFRGARGGGLEFHADLTLPYKDNFHSAPMHGQFVLVELASPEEAVLGRITSVAAQGGLTSTAGEEYGLRAVAEEREIPDDLRTRYLRYRIDIRMLGVLRCEDHDLIFAPSHRRLPHVGARVAFLPDDVLCRVAGGGEGAEIGFYALGEFVYCGKEGNGDKPAWMQPLDPRVPVRFAMEQLVARRSFVFARAGFGKSNLVKLLFAGLYRERPTVPMRERREVPVGTVVFDPDGEYFWPDVKERPALCDVEELANEIVVFTNQEPPSPYYGSFKVAGVRLDIRQLPAPLVLSIALTPEQQQQQNVHKLKSLGKSAWRELVDLVHRDGINAGEEEIRALLKLQQGQDAELFAARSHMARIVRELHDPSSALLTSLLQALRDGKLCIVDISRMRGPAGLALSGIILRYIFNHNQEQFTRANPDPIPTIAVVEEAQSVLGSYGSGDSAYEEWIKEGRKYSLGAVLVTQQPGSIPHELLSQGDSWFIFHLLTGGSACGEGRQLAFLRRPSLLSAERAASRQRRVLVERQRRCGQGGEGLSHSAAGLSPLRRRTSFKIPTGIARRLTYTRASSPNRQRHGSSRCGPSCGTRSPPPRSQLVSEGAPMPPAPSRRYPLSHRVLRTCSISTSSIDVPPSNTSRRTKR
jgi:uncharacterized protein